MHSLQCFLHSTLPQNKQTKYNTIFPLREANRAEYGCQILVKSCWTAAVASALLIQEKSKNGQETKLVSHIPGPVFVSIVGGPEEQNTTTYLNWKYCIPGNTKTLCFETFSCFLYYILWSKHWHVLASSQCITEPLLLSGFSTAFIITVVISHLLMTTRYCGQKYLQTKDRFRSFSSLRVIGCCKHSSCPYWSWRRSLPKEFLM